MNKLIRQLRVLNKFNNSAILAFTLLLSFNAFAFLGVHETAELLPAGQNRVGFATRLDIANARGINSGAFLDIFTGEDLNSRFEIGGGANNFWAAGSLKWIPYPDHAKQPAIGVRGKLIFSRNNQVNYYNTQLTPMLSKQVSTANGLFIPYAGAPLTFTYENSTNNYIVSQLCFGSEWVINKDFQLGAEFEMSLDRDTNTLSAYLNFQFDEKIGFKK